MNLKNRIERIESKLIYNAENQIQAIIMLTLDARKNGQPLPITKFSRVGMGCEGEIFRHPGENYKDFEARAIKEVRKDLVLERRDKNGQPIPDPVPSLIADGDIQ